MIAPPVRTWDIFCRVVDNYGDIGVCWRLARQLANERRLRVRLWVDDLATLSRIQPGIDATSPRQHACGVDVRRWDSDAAADEVPHDVVIEAFACDTPETFVARMAADGRRRAWINLEYLSAEAWVGDCHRLPSPHPRLPLVKHFFFPGFTAKTGGLLREGDLFARRDAFVADGAARDAWWRVAGAGFQPPRDALVVSLFAYPNPAVDPLLDAWTQGTRDVVCVVPQGVLRDSVARISQGRADPGRPVTRGRLTIATVPFVAQAEYDRLLWSCDVNFVRGEDSFVRAQWAARPFVWHIYPQADDAHRPKLKAFLARYAGSLDTQLREPVESLFHAWNGAGDIVAAWRAVEPVIGRWTTDARRWSDTLAQQPDLAAQLAKFVETLL